MRRLAKFLSVLLCTSFALSVCSCSNDFENTVLEQADQLGKSIVERNYEDILGMADEGDKKLQTVMSLDSDSSENDKAAREIIASTLTYSVVDGSYVGDFMGSKGSVDIAFEYVDYNVAIDGRLFDDVDAFGEVIGSCKDKISVTLTFDFENEDDKAVCTNISEIIALYPYSDDTFNFAGERNIYIGDVTFLGLNDGSRYRDVQYISCELAIEGLGQQLDWSYYYVVECADMNLFTSDIIESDSSESLFAEYGGTGYIDSGNYVFTFYTDQDEMLACVSVDVSHFVPTVTPTPTIGADPGYQSPSPYYVAPSDGVINFPNTDVTLDLPSYIICYDPTSSIYQAQLAGAESEDLTVFFASDYSHKVLASATYVADLPYNDPDQLVRLQGSADSIEDNYIAGGCITERSTTDYTCGDRVFTVQTVTVHDGEITYYFDLVIIGDDDCSYLLNVVSNNPNNIEEIMAGITIG